MALKDFATYCANKLVIYMFGPRTAEQRKMVVNNPKLSRAGFTCIDTAKAFGFPARNWWAKNLKEYLTDLGYSEYVTEAYVPFIKIATAKCSHIEYEYDSELYRVEREARQKFIDYMRDKYGK